MKIGSSAAAAHVSSSAANVTCWGEVLKPNVTRPGSAFIGPPPPTPAAGRPGTRAAPSSSRVREARPHPGAGRDRAVATRTRRARRTWRRRRPGSAAPAAPRPPAGPPARRRPRARSSALRSTSISISSPSATNAIGPPSAASGATWPIIRPCVPPENRPSVSSATCSPEALADDRRRDRQHLLHPGPADRALVADDDDVAGPDRAGLDGLEAGVLGVEDAGGAAVVAPLVAGELDDAALGRERCRAGSSGRRSP